MYNNRILGAAVAAALFLPVGSAYAAGDFGNVNFDDGTATADALTACGASIASQFDHGTCTLNAKFGFGTASPAITDVVNVPTDGLIYATELFTGLREEGRPVLPGALTGCDAGTGPAAAIMYTIGATSLNTAPEMQIEFTLTGAEFSGDPLLGVMDISGTNEGLTAIDKGGDGRQTASFKINSDSGASGFELETGDRIMLIYRIENATALASEGGVVTMDIDIEGDANRETVTIATSKTALEYSCRPQDLGKVQIDVTNENKRFADTGIAPAYQKDVPAVGAGAGAAICYIKINSISDDTAADNYSIVQCDGSSEFIFSGASTAGNLALADSKFEITDGQFAASSKDQVYIETGGVEADGNVTAPGWLAPDLKADTVVNDLVATWNLNDANMNTFGTTGDEMPIIMEVDGTTEINTVELPPMCNLQLDFKQGNDDADKWGMADISYEDTCLLIKRNGLVCRVFNVPPVGAADALNIRMTNNSTSAGDLTFTLYDKDGSELGAKTLEAADYELIDTKYGSSEFSPGHTFRFTSAHLEEILSIETWTGRGMLEITSTLPKVEMMVLLRNTNPNVPLLTNMSSGARGYACEN